MCDHAEVQNLLERYCWTLDHGQMQEWAECFVPDGVFSIRDTELVGRDAIRAEIGDRLAKRFRFLRHLPHPASIVFLDDSRATARSYFELRGATREGRDVEALGSYEDELSKTGKGWRISSRRIEFTYFVHRGEPWEGDLFR